MHKSDMDDFESPPDIILGYCPYCKNEVYDSEEYHMTKSGRYYHLDCFYQKHNIKKELKFK